MARRTGSSAGQKGKVTNKSVDPLEGLAKHLRTFVTATADLAAIEPTKEGVAASVKAAFEEHKISLDPEKYNEPNPHSFLRMMELERELNKVREVATLYLNDELKKRSAANGPKIVALRGVRAEAALKYKNARGFLDELGLIDHDHEVERVTMKVSNPDGTLTETEVTTPCPKTCPIVRFPSMDRTPKAPASSASTGGGSGSLKIGHMIFSINGKDRGDNFDLSRFAWFATDGINGPKTRLTAAEFRNLVRERTGVQNPDGQDWNMDLTIQTTGKVRSLSARLREQVQTPIQEPVQTTATEETPTS